MPLPVGIRHQVAALRDKCRPRSQIPAAAVVPCQSGMQRADAMVSDALLASAPETLEDTLAYLGSAYGGAAGYARAVGLNADEVRSTRGAHALQGHLPRAEGTGMPKHLQGPLACSGAAWQARF